MSKLLIDVSVHTAQKAKSATFLNKIPIGMKNSDMKSCILTQNVSRKHMASDFATEFLKNSNSIPVGKAVGFLSISVIFL